MKKEDNTRKLLEEHYKKYPKLQVRDIFKFIYQSSFGCEHSVSDLETVKARISEEYSDGCRCAKGEVESLDGDYVRVPLHYIENGLSTETLAKLFFLSAKKEEDGRAALEKKLQTVKEMVSEGLLPFSGDELDAAVREWAAQGFPAVRHSEAFKAEYKPSYRVISKRFTPFLPLFAEIDTRLAKGSLRVAVEGGSASGKSTLGDILLKLYGCTLFHMDDFFLRPEQRTPERFAEVGGNVDRERFLADVLLPMSRGEAVTYRKFDCSKMDLGEAVREEPKDLTVTEGAYSMHPELAGYYDFSVFLDISEEAQRARIMKRNSPDMANRFFNEWIPMEKRYFKEMRIPENCDMIIKINKKS